MAIGVLAVALAAAVTLAGPAELARMRTPENPRPLPNGQVPPPRHFSAIGQKRSARGDSPGVDSVIRDDFPCNEDSLSGCDQLAPKLAVDAHGGFVVSWYEFRDGDADAALGQRLPTEGGMVPSPNILVDFSIWDTITKRQSFNGPAFPPPILY